MVKYSDRHDANMLMVAGVGHGCQQQNIKRQRQEALIDSLDGSHGFDAGHDSA
jgi:hypothetical protein